MPIVKTAQSKDAAIHIMTWHDVGVLWFKGSPTVENQRETETLMFEALGPHANRYGAFVIIDGEVHPPSSKVRQELEAIYTRLTPRLQCAGYVILGQGFQKSILRAALIGSHWISRKPYPTSVSGDLGKGANWLYYTMPRDPERGGVDDFLNAVEAMMRGEAPETLRGKQRD
jgi:hypothetical protein